jgi:Alpha/beta hydrolase domain
VLQSIPKLYRRSALAAAVFAGLSLAWTPPAQARVTKIVIDPTRSASPTFNGREFGNVGMYEEIRGTAIGELDPDDRHNSIITDIKLAPRNTNDKVEYVATFTLLKPMDMSRASGLLVYGISNRGGRAVGYGNIGASAANPAGDGFDENPGHVYLASGWQGDLGFNPDRETIQVPTAFNPDGSSITGPIFHRFVQVSGSTQSLPVTGRMPASLDTTLAKLISIQHENNLGQRTGIVEIHSDEWAFADCRTVPFPGTPDPTRVCLKNGFDPSLAYELVWIAKDPLVLGVGMAAMRDVVSFFRSATSDDYGTPNPIAGKIRFVMGYGISQSGRFQKNFLLLGFNEDENGKIVWDGAQPIIAGQMGQFNIRFANEGNIANLFEPGAEGPIWWGDYNDKVRGRGVTGLLQRCRKSHTCPKIFDDFGGPEIWYSRGSVGIAGTRGTTEIPLPGNVRRYYHAGTPHGGGVGGFAVSQPPLAGLMLARNPNPQIETRRALFVALADWVMKGKEPPSSRYPTVRDGTLVSPTAAAMHWPDIPGAPKPDGVMNVLMDYDYGPDFSYNDQSGVMTKVVPPIKQIIPTPGGKVDADGNEIAGVKSVLLQAPLGTYTSWNPEAAEPRLGTERSLAAGYIPFAVTGAERLANGDPRPSIEERYGSQEGYDCVVVRAAKRLVKDRLLLQADADRLIADAAASNILPSDPANPVAKRLCKEDNDHGHRGHDH